MRICLTLFLLASLFVQAQQANLQEKSKTINSYFTEPRENIFLHLNKNQALTGEEIWYKGYVTEKKTRTPFPGTANVYVALLNAQGEKISSHVNYVESSLFTGKIILDKSLPTGKYTIVAYTNFMNNFTQDESSKFEVFVINPSDGKMYNDSKILYNTAVLSLFPESRKIVAGTVNTIGVQLLDCNGKGFAADAFLTDQTNQQLVSFKTNEQGYARFSFTPEAGKIYTVNCSKGVLGYKSQLPVAYATGVLLSANNHTSQDRTIINLATNQATLDSRKGEVFTLVISQLNSLNQISLTLNELLNQMAIKAENFSPGFNQLRLFDKNMELVAQRIIYKPVAQIPPTEILESSVKNDSLSFRAKAGVGLANLSISVLPSKTNSAALFFPSALLLDPYLESPLKNPEYYLTNLNRQKHYELDTYLICQKPRYEWNDIIGTAPGTSHEFERGLTIKGSINAKLARPQDHTATMVLNGDVLEAPVSEKGEFLFDHLMVMDSTLTSVSVIDKKGKPVSAPAYFQVLNHKRPFLKTFSQATPECQQNAIETILDQTELPGKQQKVIYLEDVTVKTTTKPVLKKQFAFGNSMADGYKVTDEVANRYRTLLDFIATQGFIVNSYSGTVDITLARNQGAQQPRPPAIYIDDVQTFDFNMLRTYMFREFDEVYINRNAILGSTAGSIRLYLKQGPRGSGKGPASAKSYMIKEGYQFTGKYKNPLYSDLHSNGFLEYGSISWLPNVNTDDSGFFSATVPALTQKTFVLDIQGITADGQVFSERKTITIP